MTSGNNVTARALDAGRVGSADRALSRRFVQFGVLCLLLSWAPWAILGFAHLDIDAGAGQLIFGLAASGPSLAALVLWLRFRQERRPGSGRTTWAGLAVGLAVGAAPPLLAAILVHQGNLALLSTNAAMVAASVGGPLGVVAYTLISGPLSEEFGWRGYLQPRMRTSFGRVRTAIVLGLSWGAWHLPLFLLPGTGQHAIGLFSVGGMIFFLTLIPFSYVILVVTERLRGGVWAAVAAHAGYNVAGALMPDDGVLGATLTLAAMIMIAGAAGWAVHRNDDHQLPARR